MLEATYLRTVLPYKIILSHTRSHYYDLKTPCTKGFSSIFSFILCQTIQRLAAGLPAIHSHIDCGANLPVFRREPSKSQRRVITTEKARGSLLHSYQITTYGLCSLEVGSQNCYTAHRLRTAVKKIRKVATHLQSSI